MFEKFFFCTISMLKEEYRRQQAELEERKADQEAEAQRQFEQQLLLQKQQAELEAARVAAAAHAQESPARQNVKSIISSYESDVIVQQLAGGGTQQKYEESCSVTSRTVERDGRKSPGAISNKSIVANVVQAANNVAQLDALNQQVIKQYRNI